MAKYYQDIALAHLTTEFPHLLKEQIVWDVPFPPTDAHKFTFIDLFAGIGGFRIAFQRLKGKCVFSSELDKYARLAYEENFGEVPLGDITKIKESDIPEHDILLAGFPCQAFSIAGRRAGFEDTRGTLFYDIARILKYRRPPAFLLENVKGLEHHKGGETLKTILKVLREDLGYHVPDPKILNAKHFGLPQNRERIFIAGLSDSLSASLFDFPEPSKHGNTPILASILESEPVSVKYYISQQYLDTLKKHRANHEAKGHGFGYEVLDYTSVANALVVGGMGRERNMVVDKRLEDFTPVTRIKGSVNRDYIRRLTPLECQRLQGFPEEFKIYKSDVQAYKQFANAVAVPVVEAIGEKLMGALL
ncbi:DNA cytosine methyltransferase [Chloroflexota bacterium]